MINGLRYTPDNGFEIDYSYGDEKKQKAEIVDILFFNNTIKDFSDGNLWIEIKKDTYSLKTNFVINPGLQIAAGFYYLYRGDFPDELNELLDSKEYEIGLTNEFFDELLTILNNVPYYVSDVLIDLKKDKICIVYFEDDQEQDVKEDSEFNTYFVMGENNSAFCDSLADAFECLDGFVEDGADAIELYGSTKTEYITEYYDNMQDLIHEYKSFEQLMENADEYALDFIRRYKLESYIEDYYYYFI